MDCPGALSSQQGNSSLGVSAAAADERGSRGASSDVLVGGPRNMASVYAIKIEGCEIHDREDTIPFSVGNSSVEHVTGVLHLYKRDDGDPPQDVPDDVQQVCVLAVPADMSFSDFCQFLGSHLPHMTSMHMVRRDDAPKCTCMAILQFSEHSNARTFVADYNGRPFTALEPNIICKAVFVASVETSGEGTCFGLPSTVPAPPGHTELPTCPVCLERLDQHISGVITTVCNHQFHNECLQRWGDASCPVCRYCINSPSTSACDSCQTSSDLWICLICGHIGCGRYRHGHARDHYLSTHHCYSLEVETGRVWDYVGDGYVHRLIQSNADGKLVEVPAPDAPGMAMGTTVGGVRARQSAVGAQLASKAGADSGCSSGREAGASHAQCAQDAEDSALNEALFASKMDAISREYTHLLTSQLESQRQYFEEMRAHTEVAHSRKVVDLEHQVAESRSVAADLQERLRSSEAAARDSSKALKNVESKLQAVRKERDELAALNQSLIDNQRAYQEKLQDAEGKAREHEGQVTTLQEQVRDLMVYLEASQLVAGNSELSGGSAQVAEVKRKHRNGRR